MLTNMPYVPIEETFAFQKRGPCQLIQSMQLCIGIQPHQPLFLHVDTALHCCYATISQSSWSADAKPDQQIKGLGLTGADSECCIT